MWPLDQYRAVAATAHENDAAVYTDGARLFNAAAASGIGVEQWAAPVDAIWIDFSKGLGGPGGAAIAGSADVVGRANRFEYMFGGAMRQSGFLAAAALYGLDHNVDRLSEDNANAARLGAGSPPWVCTSPRPTATWCSVNHPQVWRSENSSPRWPQRGVRVSALGDRTRMVTHLGVSRDDVDAAIAVVEKIVHG